MLVDAKYLMQLHIRGYDYNQKFQEYLGGRTNSPRSNAPTLPTVLWNLKDFPQKEDPCNF